MDFNFEIFTKSPKETFEFGKKFSSTLKTMPAGRQGGKILALVGDLGSGKTTFTQGLMSGFGVIDKVISPTFILMRQYQVNIKSLYHLDLYRLEGDIAYEFKRLGIEDIWRNKENIVVIEWADKARDVIPKDAVWIELEEQDDQGRRIVVSNLSKSLTH